MNKIDKSKKILWFSKTKGTSSFARVSLSMLSFLTLHHDITLLSDLNILHRPDNKKGIQKFIGFLEPLETMTFKEYQNAWASRNTTHDDRLEMCMKYLVIQLAEEILKNDYDFVVLLNGIYEVEWYYTQLMISIEVLKKNADSGKKWPKIMIWTPIDYKPSQPILEGIIGTDILVTMTDKMAEYIENTTGKKTFTLGHGCNIANNNDSSEKCSETINKIISSITSNPKINDKDIIILNANDYVPRKQIKTTIEAFIIFLKAYNKENRKVKEDKKIGVKLWLHTNIKKLMHDPINVKLILEHRNNIILSDNSITSVHLSKIYQRCQIGIQTSTGEGFSMTNVEHSLLGGLQVVPDFLATGQHYQESRGILYPVSEKDSVNESGHKTIIGVPDSIEVISDALKKAVNMVRENDNNEYRTILNNALIYTKNMTWENIANDFCNIIDQCE
jgi:glycosyltransferase involved in cell wall biosynthesis